MGENNKCVGLRRLAMLLAAWLLTACAGLPPPVPNVPTHALTDVAGTALARTVAANGAHAPDLSGFRLLPEASFAFDARIALARRAEKTLDVQYYLIQNDDVGLLLLRELRDAAARGVRVRLLVDDLYMGGQDELFAVLAAQPKVEVRLFNPLPSRVASLPLRLALSLHEIRRINHRMHNKLMLADNSMAVMGGRNIANDYFMRSTAANYIDIDVLSCGPVVRDLSASFDRYWNSAQAWSIQTVAPLRLSPDAARRRFDQLVKAAAPDVPLEARDALDNPPVTEQLATGRLTMHWAPARVVADDPAKITRTPEQAYKGSVIEATLQAFGQAQSELRISSPYFIPGQQGIELMQHAIAQGRRISVLTNSLGATDEPLAYAGYERYRTEMLRIGVEIQEIAPEISARSGRFGTFGHSLSRLHAKLATIDRQRMVIGSMNLDHRSAAVNTEVGLIIDSPEAVAQFNHLLGIDGAQPVNLGYVLRLSADGQRPEWIETTENGREIVHDDQPGRFIWLRIQNWLLLPMVGEELL
ncbi:phospholipase D family protein [Variovorax rhizosphaerae]|uniref:Phospholipase D family protein n=1 Tax=Variovorax rhizosphaerae TaxID=1836200 RepID=A0ABU8WCC3_9BURK